VTDPYAYYLQPTSLSEMSQALSRGEVPVDREKSIIAQNAGTTAANIVGNYDGSEPLSDYLNRFDEVRRHVFNGTLAYAGAESVVERFEGASTAPTVSALKPPAANTSSDVGSIVLKSGKYQGKTIAQVAEEDISYLEWTAENSKNTFLKDKAAAFLAAA
jgi:hypothetical protein